MKVKLLTIAQKDELVGQEFAPRCYFNPVFDGADQWIISLEECASNTKPEFDWINDLPEVDYVPLPPVDPFII